MSFIGRHHTEESKRKSSISNRGQCRSKESRQKMSIAAKHRNFFRSEEFKKKRLQTLGKRVGGIHHPMYGKHHTKGAKQKIRLGNLGKIVSEETKQKMSLALRGSKSCKWKGGISETFQLRVSERQFAKIRKTILERDNYQCQICKKTNTTLCVHHKVPWETSHDDSSGNLLTVCRNCHTVIHNTSPGEE